MSNDPDWVRYCSSSQRLVLVRDLADALSGFQDQVASYAARRLAELLDEGDPIGLKEALLQEISSQDDKVEFEIDAESQFEYEVVGVKAAFTGVELHFPEWETKSFEAVEHGDGKVFVRVEATANAQVTSNYKFRKWDSTDREYIQMGGSQIVTDELVEFEAIVTLGGKIPERMTIEAIEILSSTHPIYFGEIEPDWMNDPENYDTGSPE